MKLAIYQVDAFTSRLFGGNPAAVCPLEYWLDDDLLQKIGQENNLSETAFFVPEPGGYRIRWFTPTDEVDLCGHATLASAHVIFNILKPDLMEIQFSSRSGKLIVKREADQIALDFPANPAKPCPLPDTLTTALGTEPGEILSGDFYLAVFDSEDKVRDLNPDFAKIADLDLPAVIVTAPGIGVDFVSRFFAPKIGIDEDPVTGAAHTVLIPYWANRLGKKQLEARQISARGGQLFCEDREERVTISGNAVLYMSGEMVL